MREEVTRKARRVVEGYAAGTWEVRYSIVLAASTRDVFESTSLQAPKSGSQAPAVSRWQAKEHSSASRYDKNEYTLATWHWCVWIRRCASERQGRGTRYAFAMDVRFERASKGMTIIE